MGVNGPTYYLRLSASFRCLIAETCCEAQRGWPRRGLPSQRVRRASLIVTSR